MTAATDDAVRARIRELILESAPERGDVPVEAARMVEDLGYHSLAVLELGFNLEEEFDIALIDTNRTVEIRTTQEVEEFVLRELRAQAAGGQRE